MVAEHHQRWALTWFRQASRSEGNPLHTSPSARRSLFHWVLRFLTECASSSEGEGSERLGEYPQKAASERHSPCERHDVPGPTARGLPPGSVGATQVQEDHTGYQARLFPAVPFPRPARFVPPLLLANGNPRSEDRRVPHTLAGSVHGANRGHHCEPVEGSMHRFLTRQMTTLASITLVSSFVRGDYLLQSLQSKLPGCLVVGASLG